MTHTHIIWHLSLSHIIWPLTNAHTLLGLIASTHVACPANWLLLCRCRVSVPPLWEVVGCSTACRHLQYRLAAAPQARLAAKSPRGKSSVSPDSRLGTSLRCKHICHRAYHTPLKGRNLRHQQKPQGRRRSPSFHLLQEHKCLTLQHSTHPLLVYTSRMANTLHFCHRCLLDHVRIPAL